LQNLRLDFYSFCTSRSAKALEKAKKEDGLIAVFFNYIKTYLRVLITTAEPQIATRAMIAKMIMLEASPGLTGSSGLGSGLDSSSTTGALITA
jgi:hypothetical protein